MGFATLVVACLAVRNEKPKTEMMMNDNVLYNNTIGLLPAGERVA